MEGVRCSTCAQPACLTCPCRFVPLCDRCVGKHVVDEPWFKHQPSPLCLEEEKTRKARRGTSAYGKRELLRALTRKVAQEQKKLQDLRPVIIEYVACVAEIVTRRLPEAAESLGQEMLRACEARQAELEEALQHLRSSERHSEDEAVRLLETFRSASEVERAELLTCRLELAEVDVEQMLRSGLRFEVRLAKAEESPRSPRQLPPSQRSRKELRARRFQSCNFSCMSDFLKHGSPGDVDEVENCEDFPKPENHSPVPPKPASYKLRALDPHFTSLQTARTRRALLRDRRNSEDSLALSADESA